MKASCVRPHGEEARQRRLEPRGPAGGLTPLRRAFRAPVRVRVESSIQLLDRDRDALADADAHGGDRALAAALLHAMDSRHGEPRAAHAERMAERNRTAMRVDEIGIFLDAKLTKDRDALRGKGFVELDQIEVGNLQAKP